MDRGVSLVGELEGPVLVEDRDIVNKISEVHRTRRIFRATGTRTGYIQQGCPNFENIFSAVTERDGFTTGVSMFAIWLGLLPEVSIAASRNGKGRERLSDSHGRDSEPTARKQ